MIRDRKRLRHPGFNYRSDGFYYVTTCIQDRKPLFGQVTPAGMQLNNNGKIAEARWEWLMERYPYVEVVAFIIMPDHVHALLHIRYDPDPESTATKHSILELIGAYKTTSSKLIHEAGCAEFRWQCSHFLKVVYHEDEIRNIIRYIRENPRRYFQANRKL